MFESEAECLAMFDYFRWADSSAPDATTPKIKKRPRYACRSCGSKGYYRCSTREGTWDFYRRKCKKCGAETSLTVKTAFEGLRLRRDKRMTIIFRALLARRRICD